MRVGARLRDGTQLVAAGAAATAAVLAARVADERPGARIVAALSAGNRHP